MIRRILVGLLSVAFLLAGLAIAQDPPTETIRPFVSRRRTGRTPSKRKEEPPAKPVDPPNDDPKEKDPKVQDPKEKDPKDDAAPDEPEMDEAEVLNRVGKNMRTAEDRLANRELNDATRQVQDDIIKDLDSLINKMQNGGGGGDDQISRTRTSKTSRTRTRSRTRPARRRSSATARSSPAWPAASAASRAQQQQQARANQGKKPGGQKPGEQMAKGGEGNKPQPGKPGEKPGDKPNQNPAHKGGGGGKSQEGATKLAEVYKDVWGHLPETMRAEMNAYSREQFMAKYNELIKQYYSTVAEKSRKKD